MRFAHSYILWLLPVLLPALVAFYWWAMRVRQRLVAQFIQERLLPGLLHGVSPARQKFRMGCIVLAVLLVIVALARPQWGFDWQEVRQRSLDIVVAIDTSRSMLAQDIAPNRLERAKLAALDLMQQAKSDRLGLVAFAGRAFLECPLTIDDTAFRQSVEALDVNTISRGGTALAEAVRIAETAFKESDNYKVLVLITDGEENDQDALAAAHGAAKDGLRIFTIGIGTPEGELLRVTDGQGNSDYIRDAQGNVVKSHLNEELLQKIARATEGGFYLPLRGAKTMDVLYERGLAPLPKSEESTRLVKRYHEQYHWPLGAAILLLLIEMILPERRRRRRTAGTSAGRPGSAMRATTAATAAVLLIWAPRAWASTSSALREYNTGNYGAALKEYQQALERRANDPRLQFNVGAAAYRDGQYNEAARRFGQVLTAQDLKLQQQAYYNLGNTLFRLGESESDTKKKQESWEESLKRYEAAMKLNVGDDDAKFNYEFVKRKLEELKQQQQQQQDQNKQDQNQDQQQNQQQKQDQNQQNQNSQQQQQSQQNQQNQQNQQQENNQSQQQQNQQGQKKPEEQNQQQPQQSPDKNEQQQETQPVGKEGEMKPMTPQEARQLLDAQKGDEQFLRLQPQGRPEDQQRPIKDW